MFASGLVMITVVSLFVIFHVVNCSFEYMPTIIFLPTDKLSKFQPGIPTHASKHADVYQFLFHSKLFARPYFYPCSIIMLVPHIIVLAPIRYHFSVHHFFSNIFYVGVYCSLGTNHSNSSMHTRAKYSTLISTVPLVPTIQIQACLHVPKFLCQCLLFPRYIDNIYVYCSFGTILSIQVCILLDAPLML